MLRRLRLALTVALSMPAAAAWAQAAARQSTLDADGTAAARIAEISRVLFAGGALIFIAVLAVALLALAGPPAARAWLARRGWIVAAGVAFPVVALTALLAYTFSVAADMGREARSPAALRIEVTGLMWWWRVRYLDAAGATLLETANEIHIPAGQPVDLHLATEDVIHSFWVPSLAGKLDMIPGQSTRLRLQAQAPGVYRGQCAEFCGMQHAKMALLVVALPPAEYGQWLARRRQPATTPADPLALRGQVLFAQARCGLCHTVRGTGAQGLRGPDLTHVGSRLRLAAGELPGGPAGLAAWISQTQHIKPGSRMPAYRFSDEDLRALVAYLEGLR